MKYTISPDRRTLTVSANANDTGKAVFINGAPANPCPLIVTSGEYNRNGYTVRTIRGTAIVHEYSAGNHKLDSQQPGNSPFSHTLRAMRGFCIRTARDIAEEKHAKFGGVERIADEI